MSEVCEDCGQVHKVEAFRLPIMDRYALDIIRDTVESNEKVRNDEEVYEQIVKLTHFGDTCLVHLGETLYEQLELKAGWELDPVFSIQFLWDVEEISKREDEIHAYFNEVFERYDMNNKSVPFVRVGQVLSGVSVFTELFLSLAKQVGRGTLSIPPQLWFSQPSGLPPYFLGSKEKVMEERRNNLPLFSQALRGGLAVQPRTVEEKMYAAQHRMFGYGEAPDLEAAKFIQRAAEDGEASKYIYPAFIMMALSRTM